MVDKYSKVPSLDMKKSTTLDSDQLRVRRRRENVMNQRLKNLLKKADERKKRILKSGGKLKSVKKIVTKKISTQTYFTKNSTNTFEKSGVDSHKKTDSHKKKRESKSIDDIRARVLIKNIKSADNFLNSKKNKKSSLFKRRKSTSEIKQMPSRVMVDFTKYLPRKKERKKKDTINDLLVKEYKPKYNLTRKRAKSFKFKSLKSPTFFEKHLSGKKNQAITNVELYLRNQSKKPKKVNVPNFSLNLGRDSLSSSFYGKSNPFYLTGMSKISKSKKGARHSHKSGKKKYQRKYYFSVMDVKDIMSDNIKKIT